MDGALGGAFGGKLDGAIAGAMAGKVTSIGTGVGAGRLDADAIRHRTAERFTLMLRVAKVVSSHGEYPCVIRDVSSTGVRLRLFHALPAERHLALFLGNGECYFIEQVWADANGSGCEAGFRFSAPIDVRAFMTENSKQPKRQVRLALTLPATLSIREFATPVVIRDISQQGARIDSDRPLALDQHVRLKAHGLPEIFASVRWKGGAGHGLVFQQCFRLDELAQLAWSVAEPAERAAAAQLAAEQQAAAVTATRRAG
jgi:hypothetical protein